MGYFCNGGSAGVQSKNKQKSGPLRDAYWLDEQASEWLRCALPLSKTEWTLEWVTQESDDEYQLQPWDQLRVRTVAYSNDTAVLHLSENCSNSAESPRKRLFTINPIASLTFNDETLKTFFLNVVENSYY